MTRTWKCCRQWIVRSTVNLMLLVMTAAMTGCEYDSWLYDPSVVGSWERTPIVLPILNELDVIDEPRTRAEMSQVRPEDLVAEISEYVIGPGDVITVTVFELLEQGLEYSQTRRVNELGMVRLPVIGPIEASGRTPTQLESHIADLLVARDMMREPAVSIIMQQAMQNTFTVVGEPRQSGTQIGTFAIPSPDFRLLDAIAMVRGITGQIKSIQIIREISLADEVVIETTPSGEQAGMEMTRGSESSDSTGLLTDLLGGLDAEPAGTEPKRDDPAPGVLGGGLDTDQGDAPYVYIDGRWVRTRSPGTTGPATAPTETGEELPVVTQRVIEIPYERLREGDMRYNIVIRPGDVISVPAPTIGLCYIGGQISRPGAFTVPGDRDLTLRQLVFSAGGFNGVAIPERVELTRRIGLERTAIVRLNVRAIFEGTQPDIFIKPNDTVNVGTNFFALPLAVIRNGFRMSYGFGFVLDRNFNVDAFGRF